MNVLVKFRRPLALTAAVVATAFAFAAQAQPRDAAWPSKPIRFVIPFAAGGSIDVVARLMGRHLEGRLGQNVVVENRPGAGGTVGADSVARAAADGHTFLFTAQGPLVLNPFLMKRLPYNAETAFAPVTLVAEAPNLLVTNQAFPVANFSDLLAFAKSNPDKMTFGTQGVGTTGHVTGELINQLTGLGLTHVAYQGFPNFSATIWIGFLAPASTPDPVVRDMQQQFARALTSPEVQKRMEANEFDVVANSPEEFAKFLKREAEIWGSVAKRASLVAE